MRAFLPCHVPLYRSCKTCPTPETYRVVGESRKPPRPDEKIFTTITITIDGKIMDTWTIEAGEGGERLGGFGEERGREGCKVT